MSLLLFFMTLVVIILIFSFLSGEKTAIFCLAHHDWKLDMALDSYFANPELYFREPKVSVDRKKLEQLYNKYRGKFLLLHSLIRGVLIQSFSAGARNFPPSMYFSMYNLVV